MDSLNQKDAMRLTGVQALVIACRPKQWIKNGLVFVPLISSATFESSTAVRHSATAAGAFCLLASAVYLMNDITDRNYDRTHPAKKMRPIAAGALSVRNAAFFSVILAGAAFCLAAFLGGKVLLVLALYTLCNLGYSL